MRHLQVLGYARPITPSRRYGFMSGCERCGVVFANPLPLPDQLQELYTPDGKWGQTRPDREPPVSRERISRMFRPISASLEDVFVTLTEQEAANRERGRTAARAPAAPAR